MPYIRDTKKSVDQAVSDVEASVQRHGFGVLHTYDFKATLRAKGFEIPNDCRVLESQTRSAESLGLRYVSIPVAGASGLTLVNAKRLAAELDRSDGNPIILHCASGNRVGALLALKAFHVDGLDARSALRLGLDNGLKSLEAVVRDHLRTKRDP